MGRFLNTRGRSTLTIGICDRCRRKFPIGMLMSDPNAPGLKVCAADLDELDPYSLPMRAPENITPRFVRKDSSLLFVDDGIPTPAPIPPPTPDPIDASAIYGLNFSDPNNAGLLAALCIIVGANTDVVIIPPSSGGAGVINTDFSGSNNSGLIVVIGA